MASLNPFHLMQDHPLDQSVDGGMVISPHSEYAKEMKKWNTPKRQGGYGPDGYEEYPRMLYKARDEGNGKAEVHRMPPARWAFPRGPEGDHEWNQACLTTEEFTKRCQTIVHSDDEKANMLSRGWCLTSDEALAAYEREQQAIGDAAAERLFRDQGMTANAKREAEAVDRATHAHVGDIPAPKKRPRGRPVKPVAMGAE